MKEESKKEEVNKVQDSEDLIAKANLAAARQEAANRELAALIARQEKLQVERTLSGQASAGKHEQTEDEKEVEEAKRWLSGTGYENDLFQ